MYIGGLDVGTTGCKLTVYSDNGSYIDNEYVEYDVSRISGKHEIDAENIFASVCTCIKNTCKKHSELSAIGITSFGETFAVIDDKDRVLMPSMLYTDARGKCEVDKLSESIGTDKITYISGTQPHQMYSIPKIMWIRKNHPEIYGRIKRILLMQDYIVYMLTGVAHIDYSLAARTMGFDIRKKTWSKEIFNAAKIDLSLMSEPVPSGTAAGKIKAGVANELNIQTDILIVNGCHDQVAAAIGAGVFEVGTAVDGSGTVECITPVFDKIPENKKLYEEGYSVVPYVFDDTYVSYALSFTGGAVLKWFRDNFSQHECAICRENNENIYKYLDGNIPDDPTEILVMPHFAGAANPYTDNGSKAVFVGLTLEHTRNDVYKALMEGVAYEAMINIKNMESYGIEFKKIVAAGGGASSEKWLQIKADIFGKPISALSAKEAGACGTCMLVSVAVGVCKNLKAAAEIFVKERSIYFPNEKNKLKYGKQFEAYKKIYNAIRPIIGEVYDE